MLLACSGGQSPADASVVAAGAGASAGVVASPSTGTNTNTAANGSDAGLPRTQGGAGSPETTGAGAAGAMTPTDAGRSGASDASAGSDAATSSSASCATAPVELVGWAAVDGNGVAETTGGEGGPTVSVSTLAALQDAVRGSDPRVVEIRGSIDGELSIGSNKTLVGCAGARLRGHLGLSKSANVIIRNLTIVGYNCTDSPSDCSAGADAITVQGASHHLWFDHDDISDGSDGNLDLTHAVDFTTVSFTRFHYSGRRSGGHQFSNLIGHSDDNGSEDSGHLRITFHHCHWADNVSERMPRVRFGQVHLFDNLFTASGNDYCIGVGHGANILAENNVFVGVKTPIDTTHYSDTASVIHSAGNVYSSTSGSAPAELSPSKVFKPPYPYALEPTQGLQQAITAAAGPR